MKELSIFVDESGDFGAYDHRAPYYIISMVFHDQTVNIFDDLQRLELSLSQIGIPKHCIHAGPIIRQEEEYRYMSPEMRAGILKRLMAFVRKADLQCESFYVEKSIWRMRWLSLENSAKKFPALFGCTLHTSFRLIL